MSAKCLEVGDVLLSYGKVLLVVKTNPRHAITVLDNEGRVCRHAGEDELGPRERLL